MNCSQPLQLGLGEGAQSGVVKNDVLSCSEYESAAEPVPPTGPLSLVTPLTLSKLPSAAVIVPVTAAEMSLPLPTVNGRWPADGPYGCCGGATHATFVHATFGNAALKHPFAGVRSLAMSVCH